MKKLIIFTLIALSANFVNAQWQQTNGTNGLTVHCLAVSGNNIFAGTEVGGVYLSTNNGSSWNAVNNGLPNNTAIRSFATNGSSIFAGTYGGGVYLSTNNGSSWNAVNNGLSNNTYVGSLAISGNNIVAGAADSVYLSTNLGSSWKSISGKKPTNVVAISGSNIFIGVGGNGVYLSTNKGSSWTEVNNGYTGVDFSAITINGSSIFLATPLHGVYLSTDNGNNWNAVNNGLTNNIWSLDISGSNIFAGTFSSIFLSTNNCNSWTEVNNGLPNTDVYSIVISGSTIFAGTDNGVWQRPLSEMTGIEKHSNNTNITLYPNPTNDKINIEFDNQNEFYNLEILNTIGQIVLSKKINAASNTEQFDLSGQAAGIYFVKLQSVKNTVVRKIIKN